MLCSGVSVSFTPLPCLDSVSLTGSTFRRSRGTSVGVDTRLSATPPSGTAEPGDHQLQAPLPGISFVDGKAGAVTPDAASPSREALPQRLLLRYKKKTPKKG